MGKILDKFYAEAQALNESGASDAKSRIDNLYTIALAMDNLLPNEGGISNEDYIKLVKDIESFINIGLLSPLTLKGVEFDENGINKRFEFIRKSELGIVNLNAYAANLKKVYDCRFMSEVERNDILGTVVTDKIYMTAGGVLTKQYFDYAYLRPSIIEKGSFTVQQSIKIPCSAIILDNNTIIYTMDKREPKFKALKSFYDISIKIDNSIEKIDIRKFRKLV